MGFFNQSLAQVRDLFASMTPAARITSALLLGVIVVSLGYLFQGYTDSSEELLFDGEILESGEANDVEVALGAAGLEVLPRQSGRIVVPRGQKSAYMAAIANAGALPANFHTLLEKSLDAGFFENKEKTNAQTKAARERQISMLVSEMDGVREAKVLYDVRESKSFGKDQMTATVSVLPALGSSLEPQQMKMIREAVAKSIAGLNPGDIMVVDRASGSSNSGGGSGISPASFDDPYYQTRLAYEANLKRNIEHLLHFVQPAAHVQVSAELDPTISTEMQSVKPDGDGTAIREVKATQNSSNSQVEDRGEVGIKAQGPNRTGVEEAVAKNENTSDSETTETENLVPHTQETRRELGLTPKQVYAAISIPSEYLVRVWRQRTPDAKPDEQPDATILGQIEEETRTKVKTTVANLFPKESTVDRLKSVEVTVFQSLTPDAIPEPSLANEGLLWASKNSGSLIMAGLAIVSLLMLRSMVKSIPAADTSLAFRAPAIAAETVSEVSSGKPANKSAAPAARESHRPRLKLNKGPTLKDDLTELVKEDPDGAAAILRTWIGNAG